ERALDRDRGRLRDLDPRRRRVAHDHVGQRRDQGAGAREPRGHDRLSRFTDPPQLRRAMASENERYEIAFTAPGVGAGAARVRKPGIREGMSAPYSLAVDVETVGGSLEPRALMRKPAQIAIMEGHDGRVLRRFLGNVMRTREIASRDPERQRLSFTI